MIFEKKVIDAYRAQLYGRCDDTGRVYYFSADDFEGLSYEPFSFKSNEGALLKGYFYSYQGYDSSRLVVFDHGYGGGHRAYMKEIEILCRQGFRVFSYDHTGCMESSGDSTRGFAQSLSDLDACICALKASAEAKDTTISVVGHSWGAFSTLNISAIHPDITHIVAMSGFLSVERMVNQNFSGLLKPYRRCILALEKETNPDYVNYDAIETLKASNVKALLIYSDDDKLVKAGHHFEPLKKEFCDSHNIHLMLVSGKGHNPNYTVDAVKYKDAFFDRLQALNKKGLLETREQKRLFVAFYDWNKMTEQDNSVWNKIISHLKA